MGERGRVDSEFNYLLVKQSQGTTAVLGSYSAHATVLSGANMQFSADYPGYWERAIERETGGTAVFLAGAVGSHGPVAPGKAFEAAMAMGEGLAKRLLAQLSAVELTNRIAFNLLGLDGALPPLNTRLTDGIRLRPWVSHQLLPPIRPTFIQAFRLGRSVWISTPCDFSGEMAMDIKNLARVRGFSGNVTSFNGDYVGYVIPLRYYHLDGYEPRTMSFYGPNVPDYLDDLIRRMVDVLTRD